MSEIRPRQKAHIFISYSRRDRLAVDRLVDGLNRRSYRLWIDVAERGIEPGEDWRQELVTQMSSAEAVIACISPDFLASPYCREEIEQARRENKPIYPVIVRALNTGQSLADMGLDHLQFVDLVQGHDDGLRRLTNVLPRPILPVRVWTRRLALIVGAVIALVAIVMAGASLSSIVTVPTPTPLPPTPTPFIGEDIGVAVAYFSAPEGDTSLDETAQSLVNSFSQQLQEQIDSVHNDLELSASIGFLSPSDIGTVEGEDDDARERSAEQLAAAHNADIIVYGTITQPENGQLQIQPSFRVLLAAFGNAQELEGGSRFGQPIIISTQDTQIARDQLTERARALALVVEGLTHFVDQDYDGALETYAQIRELPDWENMVGREVLNILVGNAHLRLASQATSECDRDVALEQANAAIHEYQQADDITERAYARPFSGLASAMYFVARWTPEESANDCALIFDPGALEQARAYIDQANQQVDSSSHPVAKAYLYLNEARIFYAYCNALEETDEDYADYYARFTSATDALIDLYEEQRVSALAPLAATAYAMRGDIAYLNLQDRESITFYEQSLATDQSDLYQSALVYSYLGDAYYQISQLAQAAQAYDRASVLAAQIPRPDLAADYAAARDDVDSELQAQATESQ